jgi:hypothetical protein
MLGEMDDAAFTHSSSGATRKQWEDWLERVGKKAAVVPGSTSRVGR